MLITRMKKVVGERRVQVMWRNFCQVVAPSISAASYSS
jgi:hypothetical protein